MPTAQEYVNLLLAQEGDEYEWGAKPDSSDPDPVEADCSGLVAWGANYLEVSPPMPHGSINQLAHCQAEGTEIGVEAAVATPGALLFRIGVRNRGNHVAVSLGNGRTIEAMGEDYGIVQGGVRNRKFNHGCLVPGLEYEGWEVG